MAHPAKLTEVAISSLDRQRNRHSQKFIDELKTSIQTHGLLHPPFVVRNDDRYNVISGNGRVLVAEQLGWQRIKVFVAEDVDQVTQLVISVAANTLSERLSVPDLVEQIETIRDLTGWSNARIVQVLPGNISESKASLATTAMADLCQPAKDYLAQTQPAMYVYFEVRKLPHAQQLEVAKRHIEEKWTRERLQKEVNAHLPRKDKVYKHVVQVTPAGGYEGLRQKLKDLLARLASFEKQSLRFDDIISLL